MILPRQVKLGAPNDGAFADSITVASDLEAREEPNDCDWILTIESVGSHLHIQLLPVSADAPRDTRLVARVMTFQPIGPIVDRLREQVVQ